MSVDGGVIRQLTVLGSAPGGVLVRNAVTVLINEAILQRRTSTGVAPAEELSLGEAQHLQRTATGIAINATIGDGAATLAQRTAFGSAPDVVLAIREALTASGTALNGTVAFGDVTLLQRTVSGTHTNLGQAVGTIRLQPRTSTGFGAVQAIGSATLRLLQRQAQGFGMGGSVGAGQISLRPRTSSALGFPLGISTGAITRPRLRLNGFGDTVLAETYRTWVMNMATEALTEYTNFSFNSYAKFNGKEYAAGTNGLYEVAGADDNGVDITWVIRTGMMDDKKINLKRLTEILLSLRFNGPVRVRVWTDEETYYDYTLVNYREDVLHQVRLPIGKGLLSRFYQIELSGMNGSSIEIDSLQAPMKPVARRVG